MVESKDRKKQKRKDKKKPAAADEKKNKKMDSPPKEKAPEGDGSNTNKDVKEEQKTAIENTEEATQNDQPEEAGGGEAPVIDIVENVNANGDEQNAAPAAASSAIENTAELASVPQEANDQENEKDVGSPNAIEKKDEGSLEIEESKVIEESVIPTNELHDNEESTENQQQEDENVPEKPKETQEQEQIPQQENSASNQIAAGESGDSAASADTITNQTPDESEPKDHVVEGSDAVDAVDTQQTGGADSSSTSDQNKHSLPENTQEDETVKVDNDNLQDTGNLESNEPKGAVADSKNSDLTADNQKNSPQTNEIQKLESEMLDPNEKDDIDALLGTVAPLSKEDNDTLMKTLDSPTMIENEEITSEDPLGDAVSADNSKSNDPFSIENLTKDDDITLLSDGDGDVNDDDDDDALTNELLLKEFPRANNENIKGPNVETMAYQSEYLTRMVQESKDTEKQLRRTVEDKQKQFDDAERKVKDLQIRLIRFTRDDEAKDKHVASLERELKDINKKLEEVLDEHQDRVFQQQQQQQNTIDSKSSSKKKGETPTANEKSKTCIIL